MQSKNISSPPADRTQNAVVGLQEKALAVAEAVAKQSSFGLQNDDALQTARVAALVFAMENQAGWPGTEQSFLEAAAVRCKSALRHARQKEAAARRGGPIRPGRSRPVVAMSVSESAPDGALKRVDTELTLRRILDDLDARPGVGPLVLRCAIRRALAGESLSLTDMATTGEIPAKVARKGWSPARKAAMKIFSENGWEIALSRHLI